MTSPIIFSGDDEAYFAWLRKYPDGFVVNGRRHKFDPDYLVLHRAVCGSISREVDDGQYTERGYIKICAATREDLQQYLARKTGRQNGFSKECSLCIKSGKPK